MFQRMIELSDVTIFIPEGEIKYNFNKSLMIQRLITFDL